MPSESNANKPTIRQMPGRRKLGKALGIAFLLAGALLLTVVSGYYAYSASARAQLEDLNSVAAQPSPAPLAVGAALPATNGASTSRSAPSSASAPPSNEAVTSIKPVSVSSQAQPIHKTVANQEISARPPSSYTTLYPATHIHPKFWAQPLWSGGEPYAYSLTDTGGLPEGFRAASAVDDALRRGEGSTTSRIAIPLIDVDSGTTELAILNLGDSRAYETPKHLVGHIPQSPNPGEIGNAWYFGHLESPIRGEGNVFHRLPEIPDLLRDGDDVFVELENADGRVFLYRTTRTEVMHQDELKIYGSDIAQITLVACVPRLVYDHRIVVTAELVGIKDAPDAVN